MTTSFETPDMRHAIRLFILTVCLATPSLSTAQSLDRPLTTGETVWVTTLNGFEQKGDIVSATPDAIEGRDVLYRRDEGQAQIHIAPIVGLGESKRLGVGGSISWR